MTVLPWSGFGLFVLLLVMALASGCGGGGGDDDEDDEPFDNDATGVWEGIVTPDGQTAVSVIAVAAPNGRFALTSSRIFLSGTGDVSGTNLSASATGWPPSGTTFANGSTMGTFTLSGLVLEGNRIDASYSGAGTSGRLEMGYDSVSDRGSSLSKVAGSYSIAPGLGTASMAITATGNLTFNSANGSNCIGNGTVQAPDARKNVYTWSVTYSGCEVLSGQGTGLAYLDDSAGGPDSALYMLGATSSTPIAVVFLK